MVGFFLEVFAELLPGHPWFIVINKAMILTAWTIVIHALSLPRLFLQPTAGRLQASILNSLHQVCNLCLLGPDSTFSPCWIPIQQARLKVTFQDRTGTPLGRDQIHSPALPMDIRKWCKPIPWMLWSLFLMKM